MKWSEIKNLTPEERKEMRKNTAKHISEAGKYLQELKKIQEENSKQEESKEEEEK